jgi:methionyl-tRNA formyltransferase
MDKRTLDWLRSLNADVGAVVAYGTILREDELGVARIGWLNLHYSLLPELPGPAPVQHALLEGREITGVTVFRIDEGIDTGPIVSSQEVQILEADTSGSLLTRLTVVGSSLLSEVLLGGESRIQAAVAQQSTGVHPVAAKPSREMAKLNFSLDAKIQLDKIRAMNPEPMAWFEHSSLPVRVVKASFLPTSFSEVSFARIVNKQLVVDCLSGSLVIDVVQPAGKKEMSGADWFRGLRVEKLKLS